MRWLAALALLLACLAPAKADTPWTLVRAYPHDSRAFTQGLIYEDGYLYESTGIAGASQIRKVRLKDGKVLAHSSLEPHYFGEGMTMLGGELISLTWRHRTGFRWNPRTLAPAGSFRYDGEGWGLTDDGARLILSDGTDVLRFFDPATMAQTGQLRVTWAGAPVVMLNELEYVHGEIFANIWMTSRIARIDPASGAVTGWIDLTPLAEGLKLSNPDAVLNGIAYDAARDRLFVTGKYWPKLYEIKLGPAPTAR